MAVVVLAGAAPLMRSMANLAQVDLGFDPASALTFSVALPPARYQHPVAIDLFARNIVDPLRQLPAVTFAAAGSTSPVGASDVAVVAPGDPTTGAPPFRPAAVQFITHGYHETWGIGVRRGRAFEPGDLGGPASTPAPTFYVPLAPATRPARSLAFAVRTSGDARGLAAEVRRIVADSDNTLPVFALQPGEELLASSVATQRFAMLLAIALGVLALILAMTGLYAVMAYMVSQSSREYGIRIALGATRLAVVGLVAGRALSLVAVGIVLGGAAAASLSRLIVSHLFGVQPGDPVTYALVALLLAGVGAAAVAVPAVRAMRVDPAECLRTL
jgi:hypothetical protein